MISFLLQLVNVALIMSGGSPQVMDNGVQAGKDVVVVLYLNFLEIWLEHKLRVIMVVSF